MSHFTEPRCSKTSTEFPKLYDIARYRGKARNSVKSAGARCEQRFLIYFWPGQKQRWCIRETVKSISYIGITQFNYEQEVL